MIPRNEKNGHYSVISQAIKSINGSKGATLSLDELADAVEMSGAQLQSVISCWAGVSPQSSEQFLSLDHTQQLTHCRYSDSTNKDSKIAIHENVPERLSVRWESINLNEWLPGGKGLVISWDWFESPFGDILAMACGNGLCGLAFAAECGHEVAFADMCNRWPQADFNQATAAALISVKSMLEQQGCVKICLIGSSFDIKVWEALLKIPSGHFTTYSDIASYIGSTNAQRAVGGAVGRNPISWIIPCHRVLRKSGALGGFHWGLPIKRALLAWEAAHCFRSKSNQLTEIAT